MVAMALLPDSSNSSHIQDLKNKFAALNKHIQDSLKSADKKWRKFKLIPRTRPTDDETQEFYQPAIPVLRKHRHKNNDDKNSVEYDETTTEPGTSNLAHQAKQQQLNNNHQTNPSQQNEETITTNWDYSQQTGFNNQTGIKDLPQM